MIGYQIGTKCPILATATRGSKSTSTSWVGHHQSEDPMNAWQTGTKFPIQHAK
jgi:hypothetical protein